MMTPVSAIIIIPDATDTAIIVDSSIFFNVCNADAPALSRDNSKNWHLTIRYAQTDK